MTETRYVELLAGEDSQFWCELGLFLACTKKVNFVGWVFIPNLGKRVPAHATARYLGEWIVQGDSREIGRRLDSYGKGQKFEFVKQALSLAKQNIPAIVKAFKGEDEDGYCRQYRLRQGYQVE